MSGAGWGRGPSLPAILIAAVLVGLCPAASGYAQEVTGLRDGCFEATMPAWFSGLESGSGDPVTLRGTAQIRPGLSVSLHAPLPGSEAHWAVRLPLVDRRTRERLDQPILYRPNQSGSVTPVPLAGGDVRIEAPPPERLLAADFALLVGEADLTVQDEGGRAGRLLLRFRAVHGAARSADCLGHDDPRLDVAPPADADAGDFSATMAPGKGPDGFLAERASFSGVATIGADFGRLRGIVLCDPATETTVNIRSHDYSAPGAGSERSAAVDVAERRRTVLFSEVPVFARPDVPSEGSYVWFEEERGGVRGGVRVEGAGSLQYRRAEGGFEHRKHPVVFEADFRAVSWAERVAALAAPRGYGELAPTDRVRVNRQGLCGVDSGEW